MRLRLPVRLADDDDSDSTTREEAARGEGSEGGDWDGWAAGGGDNSESDPESGPSDGGSFNGDGGMPSDLDSQELPVEHEHEHGDGVPFLWDLHRDVESETMEGGVQNLKFNEKANESDYYPYPSFSALVLFEFVATNQISRVVLRGLLEAFRRVDGDQAFNLKDLEDINAEHFYSRMRQYMPLLEVRKRAVVRKADAEPDATAHVYDVPVNLTIDRSLRSLLAMETSEADPGGKVVRGLDAMTNRLGSDHILAGPSRPRGNARRNNLHGTLARSSPFHGFDGIRGQRNGRKIYINDVAMCRLEGVDGAQPCRLLELFWAEESDALVMSVRRFQPASEVRDSGEGLMREGLIRVWEESDSSSKVDISTTEVIDLCEIYTSAQVDDGLHHMKWDEFEPSSEWGRYIGEGFVRRVRRRKRRNAADEPLPPYDVSSEPWVPEGAPGESLFTIRAEGFWHNNDNLPFVSAPLVVYSDAFNAYGMSNKVSNPWCHALACTNNRRTG